jgi:hypothetical protein
MDVNDLGWNDPRCVWCDELVEPDWQGAVVIDEDERCYRGSEERYFDRTQRVIPRRYGHTSCYLDSIRRAKGLPVDD